MADYRHRLQSGFTLIEMMVVVAIMAIIASIAYPSMQTQIAQMKQKDAVNVTEMAFKQARDDALVYRADVKTKMDTSANTLQLTQVQNSVTNTQTKNFDSKIVVTQLNSMPDGITFTATKRALNTSDSTPMKAALETDSTKVIGYGFCYSGVAGTQYVVSVDALSNVKVSTVTGGCS